MLKVIEDYVEQWKMLEQKDCVITGVSGGADSVCLLFVLLELQKKIGFQMIAVHVNHGLRGPEAEKDEKFVEQLCRKQGVCCVTFHENVELIAKNRKQSTEEAGRNVRREAFEQVLSEYHGTKIALAHHMNDNVETFLLNLTRGSGVRGLGGIRPMQGVYIRPLLCVTRDQIETYLAEKGQDFCVDQSNHTDDYTRNRIRNHVIPYLEDEVNTQTVAHIHEVMQQLRGLQSYVEDEVERFVANSVRKTGDGYELLDRFYEEVPSALRFLVLRKMLCLAAGQEKDLESTHVKILDELLKKQVGRRQDLPYGLEAVRTYQGISLGKKRGMQQIPEEVRISISPGEHLQFTWGKYRMDCRVFEKSQDTSMEHEKSNTKRFDYDIMEKEISFRTRRPGDYFYLKNQGGTQKLKSYFVNAKVPQAERDQILLVALESHILWIVGHRVSGGCQIQENTKYILEIQIDEGEVS